jgi:hypothetical protein
MTVEQQILEKIRKLEPALKEQVLKYVEGMQGRGHVLKPRKSLRGLWKGSGAHITEEDIAEARHEMWGDFPRRFPE